MKQLENKRVFITGGAQGIGKALVQGFSAAGAHVHFCDIAEEAGRALAAETGASFYPLDAGDADALDALMQQLFTALGDVDIIVNNVGISEGLPLTETSIERFKYILDVNLTSAFITSRALARHRNNPEGKERYGRIVNLCSIRHIVGDPNWEAYNASKGGIKSLTYSLALSLREYNITVNCLSPGWIHTGEPRELSASEHRKHPSRRVGNPADIMNLIAFLCKEESEFINGEDVLIDGGLSHMIYDI